MCKELGYAITRAEADRAWQVLETHFPEAKLSILSKKYYRRRGGGVVVEALFTRGKESVQLYNFLGEVASDVGPFDNKCWILMYSRPWWRAKWNRLMTDVDQVLHVEFGACCSLGGKK